MNRLTCALFACLLVSPTVSAKELPPATAPEFSIRQISYEGRLSDDEARFTVDIEAEAAGKGESSVKLFEGDLAVLPSKLPDQLRIIRESNGYGIVATHPGRFKFTLELVAKIQRAEPWNRISFTGPAATIAAVTAQAGGAGMEVQLLNGTLLESDKAGGVSRVKGYLGADPTVALRWSRLGGIADVARKALLTVDSTLSAHIAPAVIKYTARFHYDIVQGNAARLTLTLPATQALTRLVGEQIRDWHATVEGDRQVLAVEFIKPVEKAYDLTLYSEQVVEGVSRGAAGVSVNPPVPLDVDRESGSLTLFTEDTLAEIGSLTGLRQINAPDQALAAYRFNARPFTLALKLKRVEPVIHVADRVGARLEETRLLVEHALALNVEKAGLYQLEMSLPSAFTVAGVRGDGVEDWKISDGPAADRKVLRVNFAARVLGARRLDVQLEQPLKTFPEQISIAPLRVVGAARETARIGTAAAPGIRLKTARLDGLREIPVRTLQSGAEGTAAPFRDELLAYTADQPDWNLTLAGERLAARIVADVFNLVTIGDGIAGGSATIRYGIVNQGVQEFRVKLPPHCRNVDFTGPNIRRKELAGDIWTIGLQDKAWGGYTLVVTYDYPFNPNTAEGAAKGATLPIGGLHALDTERETGSIAVTTAASLQLSPQTVSDGLRRVDETELPAADRSLITRAVVLAYQYNGDQYQLALGVKQFQPEPILAAVADRTQITSVLTEAGEMLTQASFMVKNNEKQSQRFLLPKDANLWSCHVNGQPAKPQRDGDWVLVPVPRDANRDQAFAVDIVYDQKKGSFAGRWTQRLELTAPRSDVPNTYAEWQLFVPPSLRLSAFGGSMNVAQGTTYQLLDAWKQFLAFYIQVLREAGGAILVIGILAALIITLVIASARRGWNGLVTVLVVFAILAVLGAMLLPALGKAKEKALRISSMNNLKQIGLATRLFAEDNGDRLPASFEEMMNELATDKITYDVETGQRFTYIGAGLSLNEITPESVIAYGPVNNNRCGVLFADGTVRIMSAAEFYALNQRGLIQRTRPTEVAAQQQAAVMRGQFATPTAAPAAVPADDGLQAGYHVTVSPAAPPVTTAAPPTAAGIRSIRIELPQTGQPFLFTKVLNIGDEALSIHARIMPLHVYQTLQMVWQVAAFLLGLVVWWWQWSRHSGTQRSSFILTLALALMLGAVGSLLIQWRALHDALIVGFPVVTVALIAFLVWKYWPRGHQPELRVTLPPEPPDLGGSVPPVVASIILAFLFTLNLTGASAAESGIRHPASSISTASIVSAAYSGTVDDRVALLDVALQFSPGKPGQTIPLFGDDVAVQQFTVKRGSAELVRDGNGIAVRLDSRGAVALQVRLLVRVAGDVTRRRLVFHIPPALSSRVTLALDQPEADVDFPAAISSKRTLEKNQTRVEAVIGSNDRVELQWTPRVKRAAEVAATVFCQNTALVTLGGGMVNVRATLDYQVTQGELRQARVLLPAGHRLLRVEGSSIRNWELKNETGGQILVVDLMKGIPLGWRLTVETEAALAALPASVRVELPHALDVKRETGLVALQNAEELGVSVESASDLQRVDVEEFTRLDLRREEASKASGTQPGADQTGGVLSVFRYSQPAFGLRVRVEAVQPQIEAVVRNQFRVGSEQVSLSATLDYSIKRVGVFTLGLTLPEGYRVESVAGTNVLQWIERAESGAPRRLEIALKERTSGAYGLRLELAKPVKELPKRLALAGVHPLDTAKLTGFIAVSAEPGVAVKTESFDGLTEIPVTALPDAGLPRRLVSPKPGEGGSAAEAGSVLAYRFISPEPKPVPEWTLNVATEAIEAWVRAEIAATITLSETLVSGRALIRYDIANAPVKELRVRVPAQLKNVEISGPNIRSKEPVGRGPNVDGREPGNGPDTNSVVWRVELQSKTRGFYVLTVTWEQPRATRTNTVELAGIAAAGVERETGMLAVAAKAPLQVNELRAVDLQRVDTSDFPDWAGAPDAAAILAYRYVRPGYRLALDARRYAEAEVLQALAENARLTTVVADDGQVMTEMSLTVRNNGRQFLEIELPPHATVWSAFVAGQPVRPSRRDGRLLLPIEQSGMGDGTIAVELTYVGTNTFPHTRGPVGFASPKLDVPLKNAHWEIYLPPDYSYGEFQGTMTRELAAPQPSSASFSILDYTRMEKASQASVKADVQRDVIEARRQLEGGNVREATANFNRAKGKIYGGKDEDADVKELEKKLHSAQASNLINAQSDFAWRNAGPAGAEQNAPAQLPQLGLQYDSTAAEQQWVKLQQAQEMAVAKVQPLHINLPVRGLRYAFSQVLQTETGKPMTVQFLAASAKAVSWPKRAGTALAAFLALWGIVTLFLRLTRRPA